MAFRLKARNVLHHGLVFSGDDFRKPLHRVFPGIQQAFCQGTPGKLQMPLHDGFHLILFCGVFQFFQFHQIPVAQLGLHIQHVSHTAGHACGKVASDLSQDHRTAAGHIFAAVVADAFHHRRGPAVTYTEPFPGLAVDIHLAAGSPKAGHVADDHICFCRKGNLPGREHHQPAAG